MGRIAIAAFKPHEGKEEELLSVVADRLPLLRRLGFSTDREHTLMRASDGTIIEISEWVDDAAIERAHSHEEVGRLWARFEACSDYRKPGDLAELGEMFPTFEAV